MQISTDVNQIPPDFSKPDEGYEWWYFDAESTDSPFRLVIIFYQDSPFSTRKIKRATQSGTQIGYFPAVSVSVYRNNETVYYSFLEYPEKEFNWHTGRQLLQIGDDRLEYSVSGDTLSFRIELNQELASGHKMCGFLKGKGKILPKGFFKNNTPEHHKWNLLLPDYQFEADFNLKGKHGSQNIKCSGRGYHDHNTGLEPMKNSFDDWYWGRFHLKQYTLVYYLMNGREQQQFEAWLIHPESGQLLSHITKAELEYYTPNIFGLLSARKINLNSPQVSVNIQNKVKIDNGPFYQRFLSDCIVNYNNEIIAGQGITEYIHPNNIYKTMFWPLVHMRLRFMDEQPHWVQKSPRMYPWTW